MIRRREVVLGGLQLSRRRASGQLSGFQDLELRIWCKVKLFGSARGCS
jgi:hypothetical protein